MKRLLILLGLPLVLSSCLLNEEDKFPKSATERMNEALSLIHISEPTRH